MIPRRFALSNVGNGVPPDSGPCPRYGYLAYLAEHGLIREADDGAVLELIGYVDAEIHPLIHTRYEELLSQELNARVMFVGRPDHDEG